MKYDEIRQLLEAYWQAESSLEQERTLKAFFAGAPDGLPEDLESARKWFQGLHAAAADRMPAPVLPLEASLGKPVAAPFRPYRFWRRYWEYAAILLLAFASYAVLRQRAPSAAPAGSLADTYQDPQKAFEVTRQALELLSTNLNRAKAPVSKLALLREAESKIKAR